MKKWFTFIWLGFVDAIETDNDFKNSAPILFSVVFIILPLTFLFYTNIDFSFFTTDLGVMLLLLSFFSASFIWIVVGATVGFVVSGTIDFFSAVLRFRKKGEQRYYIVYDVLKDKGK